VTGCNRDINILCTLQDDAGSTFFLKQSTGRSASVSDLLCNHFVYEDVIILDSILMYDDLLIGLYKYCWGGDNGVRE